MDQNGGEYRQSVKAAFESQADPAESSSANVAFIDGLPINLEPNDQVLAQIGEGITRRASGEYISITNTESMYHGRRIVRHGDYIKRAALSLCDGVGVIVAGLAWGYRLHRFNGPVLMLECAEHGVPRGWRHYFYGGAEGVADEMARRLTRRFPGLIVCGAYQPPFRKLTPQEKADVIRDINESRPDIVWVGLGLLKQEEWIAEYRGKLDAPWMIGVGAAFDYHAGTVPWAPPLLRQLGLEWLFRLIVQPKLRAKRYWWSLIFVCQATFKGFLSGFSFQPRRR